MQLAATLVFILNSRSGKFLGLTPDERKALHECLTWLRQPGNNSLCFYGAELEAFDTACKKLMNKVKQIIPEAHRHTSSLLCCLSLSLLVIRGVSPCEDSGHDKDGEEARRWDSR